MLLYVLLTVLVLQTQAHTPEDCWVPARKIDYGNGKKDNVESFEECVAVCKQEYGQGCFYITYIPATNRCEFEDAGGRVKDLQGVGYTFSSRACSDYTLTGNPYECRVMDVQTEYTGSSSYKRHYGTIAECDAFCLSFDWCAASLWWGGTEVTAESQGYCQTTDSSAVVRFFTAELQCLEHGEPCMAGKILDQEFGCVEAPTAPPSTSPPGPRLIEAKARNVLCKAGKKCKVMFVLSPPAGVVIKRKKIRICKRVAGVLVQCRKVRRKKNNKNIVSLSLKGPDIAGDYIGWVQVNGEKVLSGVSTVSVE